MSIEEILEELTLYTGSFPEDVVRAAVAQREAITPHLLAALEEVATKGAEYAAREDYMLHVYALYLLAQFREKKAFPLVIKLISQPGEILDDLLGDTLTEGLPGILASVYDGNTEALVLTALQHDANPYVRSSVMDAIVLLFIESIISREVMLGAFGRLFKELKDDDDSMAWNGLVSSVADAQAHELLPEVKQAFEKGLVEDLYMRLKDVEEVLAENPQTVFNRFKKYHHFVVDASDEMSWWAAFSDDDDDDLEYDEEEDAVDWSDHLPPDLAAVSAAPSEPVKREGPKIGRNDPCPCGSGKKYKKCCLK